MNSLDFTFDFHSHVLPYIDDGAEDLKKSLRLIECAAHAGIRTMCLTPHFYAHEMRVESFCKRRDAAFARLREALDGSGIDMKFLLGAEVLAFGHMENMDGIGDLLLEGTDYLLFELPLSRHLISEDIFDTVSELSRKYNVIIAHANRYSDETVERAVLAGAKLQLNVEDICLRSQKDRINFWRANGMVAFVGSDAHRKPSVYKKFKKASKILS